MGDRPKLPIMEVSVTPYAGDPDALIVTIQRDSHDQYWVCVGGTDGHVRQVGQVLGLVMMVSKQVPAWVLDGLPDG